jgi:hypothetical protein
MPTSRQHQNVNAGISELLILDDISNKGATLAENSASKNFEF